MKFFCKDLRKHATKIINYEKKEMMPLTEEEKRNHSKQKVCYICKKGFTTYDSNKEYYKVKDHCHYTGKYRGAAHNITFSVPIKKEIRKKNKIMKISYKIKFIDSFRFMSLSLSNL